MPSAPFEVWKYFTRSVDKTTATCNVCKLSFTYARSTTNLWNHVTAKHPGSLESDKLKQPSMKQFTATGSVGVSGCSSDVITSKIVNMIVVDYLPLSLNVHAIVTLKFQIK